MFSRYKAIHFIGIGGIGMSGLAEILHRLNYQVSGSDIRESETTKYLQSLGIKVFIGHSESNISKPHVVVISSAISPDNPEIKVAKERGIPVIPRAEMLAELGRLKYGILIAGAHGKTTTTSLIATILAEADLDPTIVIGGKLKAIGSNAKLGQGDFIVAEADESDGSFLKLNPTIAVITNIDYEHLDFFKNIEELKKAFLKFANKIPFYGTTIVCIENEHTREIIPYFERKYITYGYTEEADFYAKNIVSFGRNMEFDLYVGRERIDTFLIPLPGEHNVLNALAAIATSQELQIPLTTIKRALASFSGIQRRFELKGEGKGIQIFDDYGHHPTEIRATLKAARNCFKENRLVVIFQPHRYTRTRDLMDEFSQSFAEADLLYLMDIYSAGEKPIDGVDSRVLFEKLLRNKVEGINYIPQRDELLVHLRNNLREGDVVFTIGAGDVYKIGEKLLEIISLDV
ncbi:MAG: UDP-N-acetylmuramate--L-alanine ligase [Thermodesulfovibrionales bacterium]|nr:UDP-N-acetylmuramate--L-alanine ligase [Thermodesulfovibrionales bacterium]